MAFVPGNDDIRRSRITAENKGQAPGWNLRVRPHGYVLSPWKVTVTERECACLRCSQR